MEIFKLFGRIMVEDEASSSLSKVDDKAQKTGASLGSVIGGATKMGAAIVAGATAAGAGLFALATKVSDVGSEINDMAVRTGLSTDRLQELKYASGQAGVSFESVQSTVMKMTKNMAAATDTTKGVGLAFSKLGVNVKDNNGHLKNSQAVFDETLAKLADMKNASERNALGMKIFGGAFTDIQPLVSNGSKGLAAMSKEAHDLGLVMSKESIDASDQFGDTLDKLKQSFQGVVNKVGVELMPMFQKLMDWVSAHMPEIQAFIKKSMGYAEIIISNFAKNALPIVMTAFQALGSMIGFVIKNMNWLLPVVIGLGSAFAAYSIISTIVSIFSTLTAVTKGMTIAQWALNVAMNANPIGLIALAIGVLIAAGVALYKNWDVVKKYAWIAWNGIKMAIKVPLNGILSYFNIFIIAYEKIINLVGKGINMIPSIKIPKWVPKWGGKKWDIPNIPQITLPKIPMLAQGGVVNEPTLAMVGEQGKEAVMPLENNTQWIDQLASKLNGNMGGGDIVIQVGELELARVALNGINRLQRQSGRTLLTI